jgi:LmbE family N-acetylglucosaminyl deacetylase
MKLHQPKSEIYCWDGSDPDQALPKTTHLGVCAHQDDLEILALHGIIECFHQPGRAFSGVVVTNGAGSARDFEYADYTDEQMQDVRRVEQKKAAHIGEYAAQILMDHPSGLVKDAGESAVIADIKSVVEAACPEVIYTHNLCDKHDTHVAVALRTIAALRALPQDKRPKKVIGCEVWRDLDWLPDNLKVSMDTTRHDNLQAALIGVFDSQVAGGKRYDLAAAGRRKAHATFSESHGVDQSQGLIYGMDLTPLVQDDSIDPLKFTQDLVAAFSADVTARIGKFAAR